MKVINLNEEMKRLFPADGSKPPWRVADEALFAMPPKDRLTVLALYCPTCGERRTIDADYNEVPCH